MRSTWLTAVLLSSGIAACASNVPQPPEQAITELAPTGTLRVALHPTDQFLAARDAAGNRYVGVAPDLARTLAARIGKPSHTIHYANTAALVASIGTGEWDIAFLAFDPALGSKAGISRPYLEVDFGYLVSAGDARMNGPAEVDRSGVRIAVARTSHAYRLLAATVVRAEVVPVRGGKVALVEAFSSGGADAYAESLQTLAEIAPAMPDHRLLDGRFAAMQYAILVPSGKPEALQYVNLFLDAAAASGEIDKAIKRAGLNFVRVPPAANARAR